MLVGLLGPLAAVAAVGESSVARAAAPAKVATASCQVHAVLASKDGDGSIPKNLAFLRDTLRDDQFAAYKSFHLVDQKRLSFPEGGQADSKLSSGHVVALKWLGGDEKRMRLHLELRGRDGASKLVSTDYSIEDHGLFMIQAGEHKQGEVKGKLFFAVQCARS